jgi:hypothetical protein
VAYKEYYPGAWLEELRRTMENCSQDDRTSVEPYVFGEVMLESEMHIGKR